MEGKSQKARAAVREGGKFAQESNWEDSSSPGGE